MKVHGIYKKSPGELAALATQAEKKGCPAVHEAIMRALRTPVARRSRAA